MSVTHEVINQATPLADANLFHLNLPLQEALAWHHPGYDRARFEALGAEAGSAGMQAHARLANFHSPVLHAHDRFGHRIDQVEFHPSYHALMQGALRHRLHATPWTEGAGGHIERAAAFMLFTELEPSILCPVSMSYAVTPALRAQPALFQDWLPKLASTQYDARFLPLAQKTAVTMGMGMTEKQGGSDVRANSTRAEFEADDAWGRRLSPHRPQVVHVGADVRRLPGAGADGHRLELLLPAAAAARWQRQRAAHPAAEAQARQPGQRQLGGGVRGAAAWLVGDEGRGVPQILAMGTITRLDCALGTAGLMRQALSIALHHTAQRQAFGKRLVEQPMMKNVLADLALESEAATALAMRLARAVDRTENGRDEHEAVMRRLLTPIAKFWICKRGSHFAQEAMECLGGNGYVEEQGEGVMARIYREMPLNSHLGRRRQHHGAGPAARVAHRGTWPRRCSTRSLRRAAHIRRWIERPNGSWSASTPWPTKRRRGAWPATSRCCCRPRCCSEAARPCSRRFCASRLDGAADVFGLLPAGTDFDAILQRAMPSLH